MSPSFDLPDVDLFTTGAVGPPGQRVFYLQARAGARVVSLRLEKTQVGALAQYLGGLISDLDAPGPLPTELELVEPLVAEWVIGSLSAAYDEHVDRVVIVAEELVGEEDDESSGVALVPGNAQIAVTREQAAAFAMHAARIVESGRPPCPLCGNPLDPRGHACARLNGNRNPYP
jgi:uncharacterized repeat protein (TIGR03847 family)